METGWIDKNRQGTYSYEAHVPCLFLFIKWHPPSLLP